MGSKIRMRNKESRGLEGAGYGERKETRREGGMEGRRINNGEICHHINVVTYFADINECFAKFSKFVFREFYQCCLAATLLA